MSAPIKVKIKTHVVLERLKQGLAARHDRFKVSVKNDENYEKATREYQDKITRLIKTGKVKPRDAFRVWHGGKSGNVEVSATYEIPVRLVGQPPERDPLLVYSKHEYDSDVESIKSAIAVLEMSEDEFVAASTIAGISRYLGN